MYQIIAIMGIFFSSFFIYLGTLKTSSGFLWIGVGLFLGAFIYLVKQIKVEKKKEREDLALYIQEKELAADESLEALEYRKRRFEPMPPYGEGDYKIAFRAINKKTGEVKEEILIVSAHNVREVVRDIKENNVLLERLKKQPKK
ncbi:hypothetical protein HCA55_17200 [Listeria booriae]|uniref:Uncharacterized protein n=1 Tax=Listeria booriae TaxID=1552123 RepID=A0A842B841_9LIST|nr:hypothetical protein [Listeria booriae]MBC1798479.1 hypothetical protein [Listeria booriae]